jgi:hypothetical protein
MPSRKGLERLGKRGEWLHDQKIGAERSNIAKKIRSILEFLKRDRVKIVLVCK